MLLKDLDFHLPEHLIAQHPAPARDHSRLLRVDRRSGDISHHLFHELPALLPSPCSFFRNDATVFKARITGFRPTGGQVECLLLSPSPRPAARESESWECLLRPAKKLPAGATFSNPGNFSARVLARAPDGVTEVAFHPNRPGESVVEMADRIGAVPLPPYIRRDAESGSDEKDTHNYQTVYANPEKKVAAAAPTAGLHFTPELLTRLSDGGHRFFELTLHVGLGTFQPIKTERVEDHPMHREWYEIPSATREALREAPHSDRTRLAIGTTAVRAIEDGCRAADAPLSGTLSRQAELYIQPPFSFLGVDALITNFHLPRSTLLCLVAAFLKPGEPDGLDRLKEIYQLAIDAEYRFFSFGDAMLIL